MSNFDLVVIGGGPGGYVAAIRAAQLGLKTVVIEKENLGGICLNWGCIPTKALLRSAEVFENIKHAKDFGLSVKGEISADLDEIIKRSRKISETLSGGIDGLMKKNKITIINGFAKFKDKNTLEVAKNDGKTEEIKGKYIIVATGARPRSVEAFPIDNEIIWSYKDALLPKFQPKTLAIIGSGAIGSEFAYFYHTIGVKVALFEAMERILPAEDEEVSDFVKKSFEKSGMEVVTSAKIEKVTKSAKSATISYSHQGKIQEQSFDAVISAVGVVPNTENMNLEKVSVKKDEKNLVLVDKSLKTSVENIYAIGDIVQGPWLAHKASHEGIIAAEEIAAKLKKNKIAHKHELIRENIPACTYCHPQVASIGLTEKKAKEKYDEIRVGKFPLIANGKAIAMGDTNGFIKTIFHKKTGEILGVHMVGSEVTEMIHGIAIAKSAELVEADLMQTIFPHPSISEAIHESVLSVFDKAIHF